jgi:hypothetical protein
VDAQTAVAPEREVALDLVRHGALIAPAIILVSGLVSGWAGAASAAIGLAIVMLNFSASAFIISRASRSGSPGAVGAAAMGGYVARLLVILLALLLLSHVSWINMLVLGLVLVGSHLGLLFWETKYVSLTLGAPGLRPARPSGDQ